MNKKIKHKLEEILKENIEELKYMVSRYNIDVNIGVFYIDEELEFTNLEELKSNFRVTDLVIQIDDHSFFVVLPYVNHENSRKAFVKVCNMYQRYRPKVALTQLNSEDTQEKVLSRLIAFYNQAKQDHHCYVIIDDLDIII